MKLSAYCLLRGAECIEPTQCISMAGCLHKPTINYEDIRQRMVEYEERALRRNQPITRGEILDAIDATLRATGGNVGDHRDADTELLRALREAFE